MLGKYFPKASIETVLASIVYMCPLYPFNNLFNVSPSFVVLIIIAPDSFNPAVTSTECNKVSSTTTT